MPDQSRHDPFLEQYGPWALVTGASSGIGAEFACQLASRGFHLVIAARRRERLDALSERLERAHAIEVKIAVADLAAPDFMERILTVTDGIEVGLLVNNAGFGVAGKFLDHSLERELELLQVNCRAPLVLSHVFGKQMADRGRGGIVLVSSVVGFLGMPFMSHYAASKGYELLFGEALGFELKRVGVDVLVVCPGGTETEFQEVAGVRPMSTMSVTPVVAQALRALGKKHTVITGMRNRVFVGSARFAPRWLMTKVLGTVFEGFGRKREGGGEREGE